jgi:hypothetical protein
MREHSMLTRRVFNVTAASLSATAIPLAAAGQQPDTVTVRIRVDDSVRQAIPPILQQNLRIEPDESEEAKELARQAPLGRAVPIIFVIVGAIAVPVVLQMIREALRQIYYGGVMIDVRSQPPTVTSDLRIPANMVFVIDRDGKTIRYTSDQLSPDILASMLKGK